MNMTIVGELQQIMRLIADGPPGPWRRVTLGDGARQIIDQHGQIVATIPAGESAEAIQELLADAPRYLVRLLGLFESMDRALTVDKAAFAPSLHQVWVLAGSKAGWHPPTVCPARAGDRPDREFCPACHLELLPWADLPEALRTAFLATVELMMVEMARHAGLIE